jgi:fructose-1,6-bisphosphatase/inositol monophosphatase family enzyme
MAFDPHLSTRAATLDYFAARADRFSGLVPQIEAFFASPTLASGRELLRAYFRSHRQGDIASLRMVTAAFADKRSVRAVVASILADEAALAAIAARSYPHPIGFDKLVLDDDRATGFKFRLHIYWRGANFAALERMHLHRFEMASAIVTGELTNHIWRLIEFQPANDLVQGIVRAAPSAPAAPTRRVMPAYAGYRRDARGDLRKTYLGDGTLERGPSETFTSGDSYAQVLEDAHFVETNAETGFANGDFCSTVYIHGPFLTDQAGRALPILFEEKLLPDDNQLITPIPPLTVAALHGQLCRYRDTLDDILKFYEWLYDPRHGRNLSTGMIAGYLLCEAFKTPHVIDVFERRYDDCKAVLQRYETVVRELIEGRLEAATLSPDDRSSRYVQLLLAKAKIHPGGPRAWLADHGGLTREMWRYFGAIRGEVHPRITVLKPIWDRVVRRKLPGGMHYGHIGAMIEAAFEANVLAMKHFEDHLQATHKDDYNVTSAVDSAIEDRIGKVLRSHYPTYRLYGEEHGDADRTPPALGERRFLVDPLDGTRNFVNHRQEFCTAIACQQWTEAGWVTTDGVVCHPPTGRIYWAERGAGAFVIERNDCEHRTTVRPLALDAENPLRRQLIDFSARGLGVDGQTEVFRALIERGAALRNSGSVALILAQMSGQGGTGAILTAKDHDIEAGRLIAQEAGSWTTQIGFEIAGDWRIVTICGVASRIHEALVTLAREVLERHSRRPLQWRTSAPPARDAGCPIAEEGGRGARR